MSISSEGLETELSYRTRLLDAAWGGVPAVTVGGGSLARELAAAGAAFECARLAPALAARVTGLLREAGALSRASSAARRFAAERTWSSVTAPLSRVVPPRPGGSRPAARSVSAGEGLPPAASLPVVFAPVLRPEASVVVVHHRGLEHLLESLAALEAAFREGLTAEVLLVDNASDTPQDEVLRRHPNVRRIVSATNAGFAGGCRLGAEAARAPVAPPRQRRRGGPARRAAAARLGPLRSGARHRRGRGADDGPHGPSQRLLGRVS